jgi:hypothetical protein
MEDNSPSLFIESIFSICFFSFFLNKEKKEKKGYCGVPIKYMERDVNVEELLDGMDDLHC